MPSRVFTRIRPSPTSAATGANHGRCRRVARRTAIGSIVREYVAQGRAEGIDVGREEGLRGAVLAFARAKLGELPAAYEAAVRDLHAERDLTALIAELGRCEHSADVHAVFTRLVGRS